MENNQNRIYLQNAYGILSYDNQISRNAAAGIRFLRSSGQVLNNKFNDNWVGALIADSTGFIVGDNCFVNNQCAALYLTDVIRGVITNDHFANGETDVLHLERCV